MFRISQAITPASRYISAALLVLFVWFVFFVDWNRIQIFRFEDLTAFETAYVIYAVPAV
jgi:hypothetical protein